MTAAPSGAAIAADALRYQGKGYTYGGTAAVPGDWDCSSFVSYVLGHDLGMSLPGGGKYGAKGNPPNAHGPVVVSYAGWNGATTLAKGALPAAGDLCCFVGLGPLGHIGIALDATHMISALDPTNGTKVTPIAGYGPAGAPLVYRRINGAGQAGTVTSAIGPGSAAQSILSGVAVAGGAGLLMLGAVLGGIALVGVGISVGISLLVAKVVSS